MSLCGGDHATSTHFLLLMGWDSMSENHGIMTHKLLVIGQDVRRKLITTLPLTLCWLWDNVMWWDCLPAWRWQDCHLHPIGHCMKCDEILWQKITLLSLTFCWSCMIWDQITLSGGKSCVTHILLVVGWDDAAWLTMPLSLTRCSMVMGWLRSDETPWLWLSLTRCRSWDEIWWDSLAENHGAVTHILLVMGWDIMRLPGRTSLSLTCCQMAWDKVWHKCYSVLLLTFCAWDKRWWDCLAENHYTVTHKLLVMA